MPDHRDLLAIDRMLAEHVVDARHAVPPVLCPPFAPRAPQEFLAIASRAAEIDLQYEVAIRGEILILEIEAVAVGAVRAAVIGDDQRIRSGRAGTIAVWIEQPTLDRRAISALEVHALAL